MLTLEIPLKRLSRSIDQRRSGLEEDNANITTSSRNAARPRVRDKIYNTSIISNREVSVHVSNYRKVKRHSVAVLSESVSNNDLSLFNAGIESVSSDVECSSHPSERGIKPEHVNLLSNTGSVTLNASSYPPHLRCLIVDDVAVCRKMLCRVMAMRFESIVEATDGLDALQKVQSSITDDAAFDIILMDFQMPVMDGPTATREIRISGFQGVIIGVTGNVLPEDLQLFLDSGANFVFTKPLNLENFDRTCQNIFLF